MDRQRKRKWKRKSEINEKGIKIEEERAKEESFYVFKETFCNFFLLPSTIKHTVSIYFSKGKKYDFTFSPYKKRRKEERESC